MFRASVPVTERAFHDRREELARPDRSSVELLEAIASDLERRDFDALAQHAHRLGPQARFNQ